MDQGHNRLKQTQVRVFIRVVLMVGLCLSLLFTLLIRRRLQALLQHRNDVNEMADIDQQFDLGTPEDRQYLQNLQDTYMSDVETSDAEGNETDRVLSSQLILITTVIVTGNLIVLGNKDLLESLSLVQQTLIFVGLVGLVASLYTGIKYFQTIRAFHRGWGDTRYDIVHELQAVRTGDKYSDLSAKIGGLLNSKGANIDEKNLNYQVRMLFFALLVYLVLVVSLVGNFTHWTSRWCWYKQNTTSKCIKA